MALGPVGTLQRRATVRRATVAWLGRALLASALLTLQACGCADDEREITDDSGETCCVAGLFDCGEGRTICHPIECSEDAHDECADLNQTERHCGRCWNACGQFEQCEDGVCEPNP